MPMTGRGASAIRLDMTVSLDGFVCGPRLHDAVAGRTVADAYDNATVEALNRMFEARQPRSPGGTA
jgi:hypothetical protein